MSKEYRVIGYQLVLERCEFTMTGESAEDVKESIDDNDTLAEADWQFAEIHDRWVDTISRD